MRNIAILRDGFSDYLVIRKFIISILLKHKNEMIPEASVLDLEQLNIRDEISKYVDAVSQTGNYSFHSQEAKNLVQSLLAIYHTCYSKVQDYFGEVTNKTIVIINTDAERLLMNRGNYFAEWAYHLKSILYYSIEMFYERMVAYGYAYEILPYFIPLIPFPSSEIIVASCMYDITKEKLREVRPTPGLKQKVYDTHTIPEAWENGNLVSRLELYLTAEKIGDIYKEIPEIRMMIHAITL